MTRLARIYAGSDAVPVYDFTDLIVWEATEFVQVADMGQTGTATVVVLDTEADIPNVQLGKYMAAHNVLLVEDGPFRLFRGREETHTYDRDGETAERRGEYVRIGRFTFTDYNRDLDNIGIDHWVRPQETDYARVQALVAAYLKGSPRATTNLNGSNYVSSSNSVTVPAKEYTGVNPRDILTELATTTDKVTFIDVDGNLHYEGKDSAAFLSGLRISDDPADASAVTYGPIFDAGEPSVHDGIELFSHLRAYYSTPTGGQSSVLVGNTNAPLYDYWEGLWWDDKAKTSAEASMRASQKLEAQKLTHVTQTVTIGPIPWGQLGLLKAGQVIQIKSKWLLGGKDGAGAYVYQGFQNRRIVELRWKMPDANTYFATLRLDREPRLLSALVGSKPGVTAAAPQPPAPYGSAAPDWLWTFDSDGFDTTSTYEGGPRYDATGFIWASNLQPSAIIGTGTGGSVDLVADTYTFTATIRSRDADLKGIRVTGSGGATLGESGLVAGGGATDVSFSFVVGAADAASGLLIFTYGPSSGHNAEIHYVEITHGTAATSVVPTPPPPAATDQIGTIGTPGVYAPSDHQHPAQSAGVTQITDDGGYFDSGSVEEALQELAAGTASEGAFVDLIHGQRHGYLMTAFRDTDESLYILVSDDGKTWTELYGDVFNPGTEFVRDPSLAVIGGKWWIAHTRGPAGGAFGTTDSFGVASSEDGATWTEVDDVDLTGITGIDRAWAPQWFIDADGSPHIFISVSLDNGANFTFYEIHPTNDAFTTWSTPVDVGIGFDYIDAFVVLKDGTYFLWAKNEATKFIELWSSSSLTSGYSLIESGDWAGWGDDLEGPSLVQISPTTWRIYFDSYNTDEIYWSESSDDWATWTTKVATSAPYYTQHPDVHHAGTFATSTGGGAGVTDHGALTGLADDDHPQYLTEAEHDALVHDTAEGLLTVDSGTLTYDDSGPDVETTVDTLWGYDGADAYYDSAGAVSGEEAILAIDPTTGEFVIVPYTP